MRMRGGGPMRCRQWKKQCNKSSEGDTRRRGGGAGRADLFTLPDGSFPSEAEGGWGADPCVTTRLVCANRGLNGCPSTGSAGLT